MNEFIEAFKNTSYYQRLIGKANVVKIFLSGSWSVGTTDERSDYDLTVLTLDGEYTNVSTYEYLTYKGVKVHWYYVPLTKLHDFDSYKSLIRYSSLLPLYYHTKECVIYENPQYYDEIEKLEESIEEVVTTGMLCFFDYGKKYIEDILENGEILERHHSKYIYHLCLASYFLTKEPLDKDFLCSIKRIRWQPVSDEYKQLAVERLKVYKDCVAEKTKN